METISTTYSERKENKEKSDMDAFFSHYTAAGKDRQNKASGFDLKRNNEEEDGEVVNRRDAIPQRRYSLATKELHPPLASVMSRSPFAFHTGPKSSIYNDRIGYASSSGRSHKTQQKSVSFTPSSSERHKHKSTAKQATNFDRKTEKGFADSMLSLKFELRLIQHLLSQKMLRSSKM
jgi:hypothetical protein